MPTLLQATLPQLIADAAHPLAGGPDDFAPLLARAARASYVLIGEASHGTHEFYRIRAAITKRLIADYGFTAVAVEADWPDAYRVNRYVRGVSGDADAAEALGGFVRFPQWMWRNADVVDFVGWLRAYNETQTHTDTQAGFYGLDLYSLHASIDAVLRYLAKVDPEAGERARERYACFDQFGSDPQTYGYTTTAGLAPSCEAEVVAQLMEMRRADGFHAARDGRLAADEAFFAEQNALVVANAERYYRAMFGSRVASWNLRDLHMAETLEALGRHLRHRVAEPKLVVWAHNSHLGDARATELGRSGELNVGQLVRQRHGERALLIGFSTYEGTVTAASDWDAPAERKIVRPGLRGSYETVFHDTGLPNFLLFPDRTPDLRAALDHARLQRAIGVIYRPQSERQSHYFHAHLPRQFDAVLHYDRTRAVEPLERTAEWNRGEVPATYPAGV
jgi:erythromycin esterase-like protein